MEAQAGDHIEIPGTRIDHTVRKGEILEIRGREGAPPFLIKWLDNGKTALVYPGPDANILNITSNKDVKPG